MPVYCYSNGSKVEERFFTMGSAPHDIQVDGVTYDRDLSAEHGYRTHSGDIWPLNSTALGCSLSQRKEYEKATYEAGIPTRYNDRGEAILTSRSHRKKLARWAGMVDKDGGYSDP